MCKISILQLNHKIYVELESIHNSNKCQFLHQCRCFALIPLMLHPHLFPKTTLQQETLLIFKQYNKGDNTEARKWLECQHFQQFIKYTHSILDTDVWWEHRRQYYTIPCGSPIMFTNYNISHNVSMQSWKNKAQGSSTKDWDYRKNANKVDKAGMIDYSKVFCRYPLQMIPMITATGHI